MLMTETRRGRFGRFGGQYVPEMLMPALTELEEGMTLLSDAAFRARLDELLATYVGRPTPLYRAHGLEKLVGQRARFYLKREDLCHTGSHKLNNALGQALLAKAMGRSELIAETGAGQHGVAAATAAALLGMPCRVYMGAEDVERQQPNVTRMRLLGAELVVVNSGSRTLSAATSEAIRDWMASYRTTHYLIGSAVGPHPYPTIVRTLQSIIGREARAQVLEIEGRLPDTAIACVGGGSNAIGLFAGFLADHVALIGVEAGGDGVRNSASLGSGRPGVLHGAFSFLLQTTEGQIAATHSVAAGLDYPGVGPEHAALYESGRARYVSVSDADATHAYHLLARHEGIIPALESAHAIAYALMHARDLAEPASFLICLSGRGDKDVHREL